MGSCMSGPADGDEVRERTSSRSRRSRNHIHGSQPAIGKNQPLKHELPRWKSEVPMTMGQLASKRDEFWDTAPAFDGRKEIWDALKAAALASETGDFALAQAIINGANITIPRGYLTDCYDELGNRYQLPVYVLSRPSNIQRENTEEDNAPDSAETDPGEEVIIKLRLSNGKDLKLTVRSRHTLRQIKQTLAKAENISSEQRWFYGGKLLQDKLRIEDTKVPKGHLIQVVLPCEEEISDSSVDGRINSKNYDEEVNPNQSSSVSS